MERTRTKTGCTGPSPPPLGEKPTCKILDESLEEKFLDLSTFTFALPTWLSCGKNPSATLRIGSFQKREYCLQYAPMPHVVETLFLKLNYLSNHPRATAQQVDTYIRYFLARLEDPVEAALQEGAESEARAANLFRNFEEVYHIEPGTGEDDHVDVDLWVSCRILRYSESGYEVDDRRIPVQVKSSGAGVDVARQHMEDHGDYRFVINVGIEREDDEILTEIQGRFESELGISLTHID